jgi:hypothetical protein
MNTIEEVQASKPLEPGIWNFFGTWDLELGT